MIPAELDRVWGVLTAYDDLEKVVPAVLESDVIGRKNGAIILRQSGRSGYLFFWRNFEVTFHVREEPRTRIDFRAFRGDFRDFKGSWEVEPRAEGTWVRHSVRVVPNFFAPDWVIRRVAERMILESLQGVVFRCLSSGDD